MLTLTEVQAGCYYVVGPTQAVPLDSGILMLGILSGPYSPSGNIVAGITVAKTTDRIWDGSPNGYGDRPCRHTAWSGSLSFPGVSFGTSATYAAPCLTITGTDGIERIFSHQLSADADLIYTAGTYGGFPVMVRVARRGNTFLAGYYRARYTWKPNGYCTIVKWTIDTTHGSPKYSEWKQSLTTTGLPSTLTSCSLDPVVASPKYCNNVAYTSKFRGPSITSAQLVRRLSILNSYAPDCPADRWIWGELAASAADQRVYYHSNTLEYLNDLRDITRLLPKLGKIDNPKTWAELYLWYKYSFCTNVKDTTSLYEAIVGAQRKFRVERDKTVSTYSSRTLSASNSSCVSTWEYHYKLTTGRACGVVNRISQHLDEWGLFPTTEVVWDFLPWSFVLDWFTNLSSLLEDFDDDWRLRTYPVFAVCKSVKRVDTFTGINLLGIPGLTGTLQRKSYSRTLSKKADTHLCRIDSPGTFKNYLEATALIVAKSK